MSSLSLMAMTMLSWIFVVVVPSSQVVPWEIWGSVGFTLCNWTKFDDCLGKVAERNLEPPQHCFRFLPLHAMESDTLSLLQKPPYQGNFSYGHATTNVTVTSLGYKCHANNFTFFLPDEQEQLTTLDFDNFKKGQCVVFVDTNGVKRNYAPVSSEWINKTLPKYPLKDGEEISSRYPPAKFYPCPPPEDEASRGHHAALSISLVMLMMMFQAQ